MQLESFLRARLSSLSIAMQSWQHLQAHEHVYLPLDCILRTPAQVCHAPAALQRWLPAHEALLEMVMHQLPSPATAQRFCTATLYEGAMDDAYSRAIVNCNSKGPLPPDDVRKQDDPGGGQGALYGVWTRVLWYCVHRAQGVLQSALMMALVFDMITCLATFSSPTPQSFRCQGHWSAMLASDSRYLSPRCGLVPEPR